LITTSNVAVALLATAGIADAKNTIITMTANTTEPALISLSADNRLTRSGYCAIARTRRKRSAKNSIARLRRKSPSLTPPTNPKTITISNGVTTYTLPFDPRFSVEVAKPGSITVHSGDRTVTLPGASITVHRQIMSKSLVERAGLQAIVNSHGDTVFAIKPAGNTPVQDTGLGAQLKGVAKDIGNGLENLGVGLHRYRRTDSTGAENRDDHSGIDLDIIRRASVHDRTGNGCHIDGHREYRQLKAIILAPASF
jgi:hypothetical protein